MGMMIARHKVKDYGQWPLMFDAHVEAQRAAGSIDRRADITDLRLHLDWQDGGGE